MNWAACARRCPCVVARRRRRAGSAAAAPVRRAAPRWRVPGSEQHAGGWVLGRGCRWRRTSSGRWRPCGLGSAGDRWQSDLYGLSATIAALHFVGFTVVFTGSAAGRPAGRPAGPAAPPGDVEPGVAPSAADSPIGTVSPSEIVYRERAIHGWRLLRLLHEPWAPCRCRSMAGCGQLR